MFESVEVGNKLDKETYKKEVPTLRERLLQTQGKLANSHSSCVILINGVEGSGKSQLVNCLLKWMDARGIETHSMWRPSDEELERPPMWRFWRFLPARTRATIFFGSWYTMPIIDRVFDRIDDAAFERHLHRIAEFEQMLSNEKVVVAKFWLHLSKKEQKRRQNKLEKDPKQRWRITERDKKFAKRADRFQEVNETALRRTNTAVAPWHLIEATDARYRDVTVASILADSLDKHVSPCGEEMTVPPKPLVLEPHRPNVIENLDLSVALANKEYKGRLAELQDRLGFLTRQLFEKQSNSLTLVFEGADAAGKGGAIRRVTGAMDARDYQVISTAAPTDEEKARPYLWRFWRQIPRRGRVTIYDRSWYGRVLVERIEGFCSEHEWSRAYEEINAFEEQLVEFGVIILKFWLAISPEEQLDRFRSRQITPYKQYKLTEEDWRNRKKWDTYEAAACDAIERTNTSLAPWVLVEANDKNWARIKVLEAVVKALEKNLS